ncbi:MAG: DUF1622 domain-containing protein [Clostridia bacterium]|nr:DUF1622 domain-containing protein [Clostridia bacterium]MBQ2256546.1 DUF1622 domain-containing protein [Clostridia bacterium]MBQ5793380.1 DUF1622 domain-containing protein [Clostridia bacterium]
MDISTIIAGYKGFLFGFAEVVAYTLELIGILIILAGTLRAIYLLLRHFRDHARRSVVIDLGRALALALECKMGAEIIHTVIVRDLKELGILAVVILIRALLAVIIHWEIRMEQREEELLPVKNKSKSRKREELGQSDQTE